MGSNVLVLFKNNEGKTLLHMRDGKPDMNALRWAFWGGGIEESDSNPIAAAIREIEEELDVSLANKNLKLLVERPKENGAVTHIFTCNKILEWGDFKVHEGAGAAFFWKDEMLKIDITKTTRWCIESYGHIFQ